MNYRTGIILAILSIAAGGCDGEADDAPAETSRASVTVETAVAHVGDVRSWVFAEGTARAVAREYLTFENAGRVTYVAPGPDGGNLREGQRVTKGTVLARQDQRQAEADVTAAQSAVDEAETQLAVARAQLRQAETDYALKQTTFRRYERLLERDSASEQEFDEAEAAADNAQAAVERAERGVEAAQAGVDTAESRLQQRRVDLEETELVAPIDGTVAYKNIEQGQYFTPSRVQSGTESAALQSIPMVLIDPSRFEITVSIPSFERGRIEPGTRALVAMDGGAMRAAIAGDDASSPDVIEGEVFSVNPAVDPGGRSIQLKVRTDESAAGRLEDGMFVTVWLLAEERTGVVVAPLDAFVYRDDQPLVYAVTGGDDGSPVAEVREVELGLGGFERQQITAGVEPGDRLVTTGRFQISDGTPVELLADGETATPASEGGAQ